MKQYIPIQNKKNIESDPFVLVLYLCYLYLFGFDIDVAGLGFDIDVASFDVEEKEMNKNHRSIEDWNR